MNRKKILLIDDDQSTLDSISSYLEEFGYSVYTAKDGINGLDITKKLHPDLIISDIRMSGINGIELAHIIKGLNFNIPLILISSYDNTENFSIEKCSFGYLQKPIDIHCLYDMIKDALISKFYRCSINFT